MGNQLRLFSHLYWLAIFVHHLIHPFNRRFTAEYLFGFCVLRLTWLLKMKDRVRYFCFLRFYDFVWFDLCDFLVCFNRVWLDYFLFCFFLILICFIISLLLVFLHYNTQQILNICSCGVFDIQSITLHLRIWFFWFVYCWTSNSVHCILSLCFSWCVCSKEHFNDIYTSTL